MRSRARVFCASLMLAALSGCQQPDAIRKQEPDRHKLAIINTELGVQYMQNHDFQVALDKLTKALDLDPQLIDAHNAMGLLHAALGQNEQAETSFKRALQIEAGNSAALNNYGQFLCLRERYDEGETMLLKAAANPLYKAPENAYNNAGTCALSAGRLDAAETYFHKALEIDQHLAPALLQMAEVSFRLQRYTPAHGTSPVIPRLHNIPPNRSGSAYRLNANWATATLKRATRCNWKRPTRTQRKPNYYLNRISSE